MVAKEVPTKQRIVALLDALPEEALTEVASFVEFQRFKLGQRDEPASMRPRYTPTPMGGLWKGVTITDEAIAEARREMWGRYMDDEQ